MITEQLKKDLSHPMGDEVGKELLQDAVGNFHRRGYRTSNLKIC